MLSSLMASSEPTLVIPSESQAALVLDLTQNATASLLAIEGHTAQSSGSDDGAQFQLAPHTSAPDSSATAPLTNP
jgi:hypothetical protein